MARRLFLSSHYKNEVVRSENNLHGLVCANLSHHFDRCTGDGCRDSNPGLQPSAPKAAEATRCEKFKITYKNTYTYTYTYPLIWSIVGVPEGDKLQKILHSSLCSAYKVSPRR